MENEKTDLPRAAVRVSYTRLPFAREEEEIGVDTPLSRSSRAGVSSVQPMPERSRFALSGATLLSLVSLARVALQFAAIPLLARLLGPYPYGLMAVAMPVILVAMQVSDFGLSSLLIRQRNRADEDTGFWIGTVISLFVSVALIGIAWFVGERIHPEAGPVILGMVAMPWLTLAMAVPLARLTRENRLGIIALGDMAGAVLGLGVAIYGALADWGVWCLVAQQLVLLLARALTYLIATRYSPRLAFDRLRFRELFAGGASLTGSNLFATASRSLDNLLVGVLIGPRPAGAYTMTYQFVRLPDTVIGGPIFLSLTGRFARSTGASDEAEPAESAGVLFATKLRSLAFVIVPAMVGLALLAEPVVALLLGPQWAGADKILAALCGAGLFLALGTVNLAVTTGIGAYRLRAVQSAVQFVAVLAAVAIGAMWDVVIVGWAVSAAYALQFAWAAMAVSRRLGASSLAPLTALAMPTLGAAALIASVLAARASIDLDMGPIADIALFGTIGAAAYVATIVLARRHAIKQDLADIMALLK